MGFYIGYIYNINSCSLDALKALFVIGKTNEIQYLLSYARDNDDLPLDRIVEECLNRMLEKLSRVDRKICSCIPYANFKCKNSLFLGNYGVIVLI